MAAAQVIHEPQIVLPMEGREAMTFRMAAGERVASCREELEIVKTATRLVAAFDPVLDTIEVRLDELVANAVQLRMVDEVARRESGITLRSVLEAGAKDRLGDREIAAGSAVGECPSATDSSRRSSWSPECRRLPRTAR